MQLLHAVRRGIGAEVAGQAEAMGDSLGSLAFTAALALFLTVRAVEGRRYQ